MADATAQGLKWIGILIVYFLAMTFIVSVIQMAVAGGEISSTLNSLKSVKCDEPRYTYQPFNLSTKSSDSYTGGVQYRMLMQLDCEQSVGVTGNDTCSGIHGCNWVAKNVSVITQFWWWITFSNTTSQPTCLGNINGSYYNISTYTSPLFHQYNVASNEGRSFGNTGSACSDPAVIKNETLCEMLSCTWRDDGTISDFTSSKIKMDSSLLGVMWNTVSELFTFRFDFGFDNAFITYFLNFLVFWLPLILLGFAVAGIALEWRLI
jgi:hypothetical protein